MNRLISHLISAASLVAVSFAPLGPAYAFDAKSNAAVNIDASAVAIRGHDPVAYFKDAKPIVGSSQFKAAHAGVTYQFATAANRDAFVNDPVKYLPQYGGFCAYAAALGYKADADPVAFRVIDGKLYLNYNAAVNKNWSLDAASYIDKANLKWSSIKDKAPAELK
jgi:YHS domain-containing protein